MSQEYDAIIVGARCAGSPTAMLLARRGYRVLLVDRATFPSDTISTHIVHPPGVAALRRWGLLDRLASTGCPPITNYSFDFGPIKIVGSLRPDDGVSRAYCPRRTVLDYLLVEAAVAAGAELRERFTVDEVLVEDGRVTGLRGHTAGGMTITERARVVVGADGRPSLVANAVQAPRCRQRPAIAVGYYAYWSGLPAEGWQGYIRPPRAVGVAPTNDGLTMVTVNWPRTEFAANRGDVEGTCAGAFALVPEFAERVHSATRETRFVGTGDLPNYFRKPYGPGWALVGDAGYHKDPITAQGIGDAFRDAEELAAALDDALSGRRGYDDAMAEHQQARDERALPMYEFTCDLARLEPPPPELQRLLWAVQTSQAAMDGFVSVIAGTVPVPEFFGPENTERTHHDRRGHGRSDGGHMMTTREQDVRLADGCTRWPARPCWPTGRSSTPGRRGRSWSTGVRAHPWSGRLGRRLHGVGHPSGAGPEGARVPVSLLFGRRRGVVDWLAGQLRRDRRPTGGWPHHGQHS